MRMSDEIQARLNHSVHELCEVQQLLATASDRVQTAFDAIQVCNARAEEIDPTINGLNRQIHALNEDMDRVFALRNDESGSYLIQENAQLKRDVTALQTALRCEIGQHQAQLTDSVKPDQELVQRVQSLEQFITQLKTRINEMREQYESAIIDNVDQRHTIAAQADTIKALQGTPAFNVIANTMDTNGATSNGSIPFGKTVVETKCGLTVTIESSPDSSPKKASLHHGWINEIPSGAAVPFPDIAPQSQFTSLAPANGGSTQVAIRTPGRPKGCAIVKGTQEANESFERMQRTLNFSPLANLENIIDTDNNGTADSSSSASGSAVPIIRPFGGHPVTPSKVKSKLNPVVEAFTPSNSSGKDSAKSGSMQASSPSKNQFKPSVTATTTKEKKFVPPHLRLFSEVSNKKQPVTITEELSVKDKIKDQSTIVTSSLNEYTKEAEPLQATPLTPRVLPHLRSLTNVIKNEDAPPSQEQRSGEGKHKEDTIEGIELLSHESALSGMNENMEAATTSSAFVRPDPGLQAWLDSQEKAQPNNASANDPASMTNDTLIEIEPDISPKAGEDRTVPLPPGFIPISAKDAPVETETAAPINPDQVASPIATHSRVIHRNPTVEDEGAASGQEVSVKPSSEEEKNATFLAEYNRKLSSVSEKYGRDSRKGSDAKEDGVDPIKYEGPDSSYIPSKPTGTHEPGALLDKECYNLVFKPRQAVKVDGVGQEWKAVRKNGKVVYVL
ncbi:hypothetical protein HO173_007035 [Letharia columbiana]|uniref:Uncharacterized protein n=1 Tax=Letharia columbiana TaxID=112416 RepID=A0A8H6FUB5_9LECA|nr:uncharacterized protein HO173_007035 [Letharia columbiana]KAF6234815.1 hypothetical protein HO173_007035 [Letharia columbiana]